MYSVVVNSGKAKMTEQFQLNLHHYSDRDLTVIMLRNVQ